MIAVLSSRSLPVPDGASPAPGRGPAAPFALAVPAADGRQADAAGGTPLPEPAAAAVGVPAAAGTMLRFSPPSPAAVARPAAAAAERTPAEASSASAMPDPQPATAPPRDLPETIGIRDREGCPAGGSGPGAPDRAGPPGQPDMPCPDDLASVPLAPGAVEVRPERRREQPGPDPGTAGFADAPRGRTEAVPVRPPLVPLARRDGGERVPGVPREGRDDPRDPVAGSRLLPAPHDAAVSVSDPDDARPGSDDAASGPAQGPGQVPVPPPAATPPSPSAASDIRADPAIGSAPISEPGPPRSVSPPHANVGHATPPAARSAGEPAAAPGRTPGIGRAPAPFQGADAAPAPVPVARTVAPEPGSGPAVAAPSSAQAAVGPERPAAAPAPAGDRPATDTPAQPRPTIPLAPPAAPSPAASAPPSPLPAPRPAREVFAAAIDRSRRQAPAAPEAAPLAPAPTVAQAVGTPEAPLDLTSARWTEDAVARIERMLDRADAGDTRVRLKPDALGVVDVSVRRDGAQVQVHFRSEVAETRQLLRDAAPRLAEAADARGLRLGDTSVGGGSDPQGRAREQRPAPVPPSPRRAPARPGLSTTDQRIA